MLKLQKLSTRHFFLFSLLFYNLVFEQIIIIFKRSLSNSRPLFGEKFLNFFYYLILSFQERLSSVDK